MNVFEIDQNEKFIIDIVKLIFNFLNFKEKSLFFI